MVLTMDRAALARIAERIKTLSSEDPFMKEANVKLKVVQPLLAALGWDTTAGDVEMEWSVRMGSKTAAVDFALCDSAARNIQIFERRDYAALR